ncbi:hypothetical protein QTN25_002468 [Entamoeba marina]
MAHEFTEKNIYDLLETTNPYELLKFAIDGLNYDYEFNDCNDLKAWVAEQITPYVNNPDISNDLDLNDLLGIGVNPNNLRRLITNQVTEFINIPRIENQIDFTNFFDGLVEVYDKNIEAYNNFLNNTINERNIYDLLEGYENDKLRLFATEYLDYNDEFDDYDTLKGWIANQLKE